MVASLLLGAAGCAAALEPKPQRVEFTADDSVRIVADFIGPRQRAPVFVLLHGLGSSKGEWGGFAGMLATRGYGSLAIDGRGHGGSGGPRYVEFRSPEAWEALVRDLEAAMRWLEKRKVPRKRIVLAGASIGANLILRAAVREPRVLFVVLLSPGVDYQGIRPQMDLEQYRQPVIMAAAADDPYAFKSCELLFPMAKNKESRFLKAVSGHGVRMLEGRDNAPFVRELLANVDQRVLSAAAF